MSVENAIKFLAKVGSDPAFRTKVEQAAPAARVGLAHAAGFAFTRAEYDQALAKVDAPRAGELSDADLEKVSGGVGIDINNISMKDLMDWANMGSRGMTYGGPSLPPLGDDTWNKPW